MSKDAVPDEKRGLFFQAHIKLEKAAMRVDEREVTLTPGMAVSAEISTGRRSVLEFFLDPIKREGCANAKEAVMTVLSFLLVLLPSSSLAAGDSPSYTYRLVKSEDDRVCRRMTAVYNKHFSQPFDGPTSSGVDSESNIPVHSRYPTSPEFDAVKWEFKIYPLTRLDGRKETWSGLISEFDIDNDGIRNVVIKSSFFRGAADEDEQLKVFSSREFDRSAIKDAREFFVGQREGSKPRIIQRGAILRPFVLNRKTYLSAYDYKRYTAMPGMGETRNSAHTPPQFMRIYQYEGGGHRWPGFESELRLTELCVISMSRTK